MTYLCLTSKSFATSVNLGTGGGSSLSSSLSSSASLLESPTRDDIFFVSLMMSFKLLSLVVLVHFSISLSHDFIPKCFLSPLSNLGTEGGHPISRVQFYFCLLYSRPFGYSLQLFGVWWSLNLRWYNVQHLANSLMAVVHFYCVLCP